MNSKACFSLRYSLFDNLLEAISSLVKDKANSTDEHVASEKTINRYYKLYGISGSTGNSTVSPANLSFDERMSKV